MKQYVLLIILFLPITIFCNNFYTQDEVNQGEPIIFIITPITESIDYTFTLFNKVGKEILVIPGFNYYLYEEMLSVILGLGGIPTDLPPGEYKIKAVGRGVNNTYFFERPIIVKKMDYPESTINGNEKMSGIINGEIDQERIDQSNRLWDAISSFSPYILHEQGTIIKPVDGRHSSPFGFKRVTKYPNGKKTTSIHYGEDLAIKTGTPVLSDGRGRILLAENRIVTGNTVVIEHLPGVKTVYYHMNSLSVVKGDLVEKGSKIGEVGSTGYSTGPHLHWEIRFSTVAVNPMQFLHRSLLDKTQIMNIINSTNNKKGG